MTTLRRPQIFLYSLPVDHSVGNSMLYDRSDLYDVAERIASAEGRIARLQGRLSRLADEGSDDRRERETLTTLSANLSQLYARQARMRSFSWRLRS
jgi:hypothetical protein